MDAGLVVQYALIAVAVAVSAVVVAKRQFPGAVRRTRVACALALLRDGSSPRRQKLGRLIAPAPAQAGDACGSCNGCEPSERKH